jgi:hypothetical protein
VDMLGDFHMCVSFIKCFSSIKIMHVKERTTHLTDIYNEEKAGNTIISWKQIY